MKRLIVQLALPFSILLATLIITWQWSWFAQSLPAARQITALFIILPLLPYVIFGINIFMGWRYNNGGLIFTSLLLITTYFIFLPPNHHQLTVLAQGLLIILPLNLLFFSWHSKRRLFTTFGLVCLALVILEVIGLIILCAPDLYQGIALWKAISHHYPHLNRALLTINSKLIPLLSGQKITPAAWFTGSFALLIIFLRFWRGRDILLGGQATAIILVFLAHHSNHTNSLVMISFAAAGVALLLSTIEASFFMAYYDELTELPGRRSLNETMLNLGRHYAIAMLDIDHFKKFNDTYGHKTGDDVLRLVASLINMTSGGAKAFRYGGEEFTLIFPGKSALEAMPHLDQLRQAIADTPFQVRGPNRKKNSAQDRGKKQGEKTAVQITISIGVAENSKKYRHPEAVIKRADTILYKAKKAGRNRVKRG